MGEKAVIFLTGASRKPDVERGDIVICADSGYLSAIGQGIRVDHLVGDMDSLSLEYLSRAVEDGVTIHRFPPHKDGSDGELALELALELGFRYMEILGGKSGRLDHFLSTVFFNSRAGREVTLEIWMEKDLLLFLPEGRSITKPAEWEVISILPYGGDCIVTTTGLKWELAGDTIEHGSTRGVHNEAPGETFTVTCDRGALLLILSGMK